MAEAEPPRPDWRQRAVLSAGVLALAITSGLWIYKAYLVREDNGPETARSRKTSEIAQEEIGVKPRAVQRPAGETHGNMSQPKPATSFLDTFGKADEPDDTDTTPALANEKLSVLWQTLENSQERFAFLDEQLNDANASKDQKRFKEVKQRLDDFAKDTDKNVAGLQRELARARRARPQDPVPQWLTGELLIFVRGDPELILPYFKRAAHAGLDTARLWASLSRVQFEKDSLDVAYQSARQALERDPKDRYVWQAFTPAAFALERFGDVSQALIKAYASRPPAWAKAMLDDAVELEAHWKIEQNIRNAEQKADDLPRVRLLIEHRRYSKEGGKVESTGTGEVVLELFEDQAPATVANFLTLVSQKFYDGTKFFLADPQIVAGGCPLTKNADPADDGSGGPGYTIPDEFTSPKARRHFRGALSMINSGQSNSVGSRFLITRVPQPQMDGHFTVFGRVLKGQNVIERITQGRTHPEAGPFGRIVPGDVIVRAEVMRKRAHEYRVIKTR